jgi:sugar phosphate isomerase/epimerase
MPADPAPISVQLYSLRAEATNGLRPVLDRLGRAGFVGVELAGFHDLTPAELPGALDDAGLVLSSAHLGDLAPDAIERALDDLQPAGATTVVAAFLPPDAFADEDAVLGAAETVNRAAAVAASRGVDLGYHNHFWELRPIDDGRRAWDVFLDALDPAVFVELDIYWTTVGGTNPAAEVAALGERARLLHVKDGPGHDPAAPMVAVGSGSLDIPGILGAAPAAHWHIVELDRCETDMFEAIEASERYLVGNGLSRGRS